MIVIGLTGSIGMGKSTTTGFFLEAGVPVHDSDAAVHNLYSGSGAALVEAAFPGVLQNGIVDRSLLSSRVLNDPRALKTLESIVHPFIGKARQEFLTAAQAEGKMLVVLDIPLMFEIGMGVEVDIIVVVTAPENVQRARVLARPGMTNEKFEKILARQIQDATKRRHAHFLIDTSKGLDAARRRTIEVLRCVAYMN